MPRELVSREFSSETFLEGLNLVNRGVGMASLDLDNVALEDLESELQELEDWIGFVCG